MVKATDRNILNIHTLRVQAAEIYQGNKAKGFWPENPFDRPRGNALALAIGELYESLEAHRKGRRVPGAYNLSEDKTFFELSELIETDRDKFKKTFEAYLKDTVEDEIADTYVRLLDYAGGYDILQGTGLGETTSMTGDASAIYRQLLLLDDLKHTYGDVVMDINRTMLNYQYSGEVDMWFETLHDLYYIADYFQFNLDRHVALKLQFNGTRPYKHGKEY